MGNYRVIKDGNGCYYVQVREHPDLHLWHAISMPTTLDVALSIMETNIAFRNAKDRSEEIEVILEE